MGAVALDLFPLWWIHDILAINIVMLIHTLRRISIGN